MFSAEFILNLSFLVFTLTALGLLILFADSLLLRFELKTFLKAAGFTLLTATFFLNFLNHSFNQIAIVLSAASFSLIFISTIIDSHSKLKLLAILALGALFFLRQHTLLFALSSLISVAVFQLVYTTKHKDLIPFGISFVLIGIGEYFYSLEAVEPLKYITIAGAFLYLFASAILLSWLWSYLAIRIISLIKPQPY